MSVFASGFCENFYGFQHFHSVYSTSLNRLIMVELEIFQVIGNEGLDQNGITIL